MNPQTQMQEGEQVLAHIWKTTALRGVLAIAFAVVVLVWPNIGLTSLIALFGAYALVSGLGAIAGLRSRRIAVEERLAQACDGAGDGGQEQRERVTAARDELAQQAHQLPTKFN